MFAIMSLLKEIILLCIYFSKFAKKPFRGIYAVLLMFN